MYEIKKINVLSVAKISTFIIGGSYIILGILFSSIISMSSGLFYNSNMFGYGDFPYIAVLVSIVVSAAVGFGVGALAAFIYNLVSSWIGGIKMDIELMPEESHQDNQSANPSDNVQQN